MRKTMMATGICFLAFVVVLGESAFLPEYYNNNQGGTFYGSFSSPLYHQFRYGLTKVATAPLISYTPKPIPAQLPIAKPFDIEIMKPLSQLREKKSVPLYVIPQNALHVVPHVVQDVPARKFEFGTVPVENLLVNNPGHILAIEIPLDEPMIIGRVSSHVLAPSGFNVYLENLHLEVPIFTAALLAPVPVGTVISEETPVIITTIYAVPSLPNPLPSFYPILAQFPSKMIGPSKGTTKLEQSVQKTFVTVDVGNKRYYPSTSTENTGPPRQFVTYPAAVERYPVVEAKYPATSIRPPPTPLPSGLYQEPQVIRDDNDLTAVAISTEDGFTPRPFINDKESPYLQELREESIRSQISELQKQLNTLIAIRNQRQQRYQ